MAEGSSPGISRREEYAEATRRAIVAAARQLFSERGWNYERAERWLCNEASRALLRNWALPPEANDPVLIEKCGC
jgi:hypothetical protein